MLQRQQSCHWTVPNKLMMLTFEFTVSPPIACIFVKKTHYLFEFAFFKIYLYILAHTYFELTCFILKDRNLYCVRKGLTILQICTIRGVTVQSYIYNTRGVYPSYYISKTA